METFDLVIIGAGPAGLSASIYASRYGIKHLVLGEVAGGLLTQTFEIGNWLGTEMILGSDFARTAAEHVKSYGTEIRPETVERLEQKADNTWHIALASGGTIESKTILFATGTQHRHLGVPGEHELAGKGVSYCPTCDGFFFRKKTVAVVGGGDSAASAGVYLAGVCERVYIIVREKTMLAERFWQESLAKLPNVEILYETNVTAIEGENKVEHVQLDKPYKESTALAVDGVFIEIGLKPNTQLVDTLGIEKDTYGYIVTEADQSTSLENLWAAGDITTNSNRFHQIVTAASEGAIAVNSILTHLQRR
ncbi:MAG: FAD-dependent oxidoreductase [Candidatus Moraniibacteriota bacterium]